MINYIPSLFIATPTDIYTHLSFLFYSLGGKVLEEASSLSRTANRSISKKRMRKNKFVWKLKKKSLCFFLYNLLIIFPKIESLSDFSEASNTYIKISYNNYSFAIYPIQ